MRQYRCKAQGSRVQCRIPCNEVWKWRYEAHPLFVRSSTLTKPITSFQHILIKAQECGRTYTYWHNENPPSIIYHNIDKALFNQYIYNLRIYSIYFYTQKFHFDWDKKLDFCNQHVSTYSSFQLFTLILNNRNHSMKNLAISHFFHWSIVPLKSMNENIHIFDWFIFCSSWGVTQRVIGWSYPPKVKFSLAYQIDTHPTHNLIGW